jgi:hypothetical protein
MTGAASVYQMPPNDEMGRLEPHVTEPKRSLSAPTWEVRASDVQYLFYELSIDLPVDMRARQP